MRCKGLDTNGFDRVPAPDLIQDIQTLSRLPEYRVLLIQKTGISKTHIKLRSGRVGIGRACHCDGATHVRLIAELCVQLVTGASRAVALRVTPLNDESRLDAVKGQAIIKARVRKFDKGGAMLRRIAGIESENDVALYGSNARLALARLIDQRGEFISGGWGVRHCTPFCSWGLEKKRGLAHSGTDAPAPAQDLQLSRAR